MKAMKQTLLSGSAFALFLMAVLTVGCTDPIEEIVPDGPVTLSTSVSFSDATKALSSTGVKTFDVGDRIAVIYKNAAGQTKKAVSDALTEANIQKRNNLNKYAEFTVTLNSPMSDGPVRFIYPAEMAKDPIAVGATIDDDGTINFDALDNQDGTLAYVSRHLDLCTYDGTFSGGTLPTNVSLSNRLALCNVFFKFYNSDVQGHFESWRISDGTHVYSVGGSNNTNNMWVAMRPVTSDQTLEFQGVKGEGQYYRKLTGKALEAGNFYSLKVNVMRIDGILLAGKYTVNASGGQVYFSKGNLQYKGGGTEESGYYFAERQWECNAPGNTTATNRKDQTALIDLFGWGTGGMTGQFDPTELAKCYNPWDISTNSTDYYAYADHEKHLYDGGKYEYMADWGYWGVHNGGWARKYWRTLKNFTNAGVDNEWQYLLETRTTGKTVAGTDNARYTMATINTDSTGVNGLILFPDNYAGPTASTADITFGAINSASEWGTTCTTAGWATLEAAGCVFLPAAGYRYGSEVKQVGSFGYYWSSSCDPGEHTPRCSYGICFGSDGTLHQVNARLSNPRAEGYCVRLVKDVNSLAGTL